MVVGGTVVVVVGAAVVVVVVVVVVARGEAWACAGTITDLTTGRTHRSGRTNAPNVPPPRARCKIRRRSTLIPDPVDTSCREQARRGEPATRRGGIGFCPP